MSIQRIKDKIAKLIALASSTKHEAERDNAMRKAFALMQKHELTKGDIGEKNYVEKMIRHRRRVFQESEKQLFAFVTEAFGVYGCFSCTKGFVPKLYFVGVESDIEIAEYVFDVGMNEIDRMKREFKTEHRVSEHYANQYKYGLCVGFGRRLLDSSRKAGDDFKGKGLIPMDTRAKDAKDWYKQANKVRSHSGSGVKSKSAAYLGIQDSKNVQVNKAVNTTQSETLALGVQ